MGPLKKYIMTTILAPCNVLSTNCLQEYQINGISLNKLKMSILCQIWSIVMKDCW